MSEIIAYYYYINLDFPENLGGFPINNLLGVKSYEVVRFTTHLTIINRTSYNRTCLMGKHNNSPVDHNNSPLSSISASWPAILLLILGGSSQLVSG